MLLPARCLLGAPRESWVVQMGEEMEEKDCKGGRGTPGSLRKRHWEWDDPACQGPGSRSSARGDEWMEQEAPWCQRALEAAQGLGRWPPVSLFSPPFIFVYRDLSFEMTLCFSLSAGLSLELPVPQQEPMELGHLAGRTGKQGHDECMCRAYGGTP